MSSPTAEGRPVGVGIIGASPDAGWARVAHVPAIEAVPGLALVAVATSRAETAAAAAQRFGARHAFTDASALAGHPDVDLVVVAVKVPQHAALVGAAISAGKPVLCEWPLGRTTDEAAGLAELARAAGVRTAVGLQGRANPAVRHARALLADGYAGRITSVGALSALSVGSGFLERQRYRFDPANGATLLDIMGGHTLDTIGWMAGDLAYVSAELQVQQPIVRFADSGAQLEVAVADQVLAHGRLRDGGALSLHLHGLAFAGNRTVIEITGTQGVLRLESRDPAGLGVQMQDFRLLGAREAGAPLEDIVIPARPDSPSAALSQPAAGVAEVYAQLATDLRSGTSQVPDFDAAVRVHRTVDAIAASAADDSRRIVLA